APVFSPSGGYRDSGTEIVVGGPASASFHYMPDGSDPRETGGTLRPGALTHVVNSGTDTLVPWSATGWRYQADGTDPGATWKNPGYNDSSWPVGTAELGYGDGDEATVIPIVDVNPSQAGVQKAAACFFRRTFPVEDPAEITSLTLRVEYDDACAVYLNGVRVAGTLPVDVAYNYYSGGAIEDTILEVAVDPSLLVDGQNLVAVQVHQSNDTSSDL